MIALVTPVIDLKVRGLCCKPYHGHPHGCPNFNVKPRCPMQARPLGEVLDLSRPVFAVWTKFNLGAHVERMRALHSDWSQRQLVNCYYWQGTARKGLRGEINGCVTYKFSAGAYPYVILDTPEACGVNVTATMATLGATLEWPPKKWAYQVALVGTPAKNP